MIADYSAEIKLWSSNPFINANLTNEDYRQIVGESQTVVLHILRA